MNLIVSRADRHRQTDGNALLTFIWKIVYKVTSKPSKTRSYLNHFRIRRKKLLPFIVAHFLDLVPAKGTKQSILKGPNNASFVFCSPTKQIITIISACLFPEEYSTQKPLAPNVPFFQFAHFFPARINFCLSMNNSTSNNNANSPNIHNTFCEIIPNNNRFCDALWSQF